jgi:hypothetical protein
LSLRPTQPLDTHGRLVRHLLAALVGAVLLLAHGATVADGATRPLRTGVSYLYVADGEPVAFQRVKQAGAKMVLTPLEWGFIVPRKRPDNWQPENPADPNYEWELYDRWVSNAVAAGLTPILQIRGAPPWALRCGYIAIDTPCDPNPDDLVAFATAAAQRYSGRFGGLPQVRYWQGLNEPNLSLFFEPQFIGDKAASPDLYRTLINAFYAAVKAVDPTNIVIAAGLGPISVPRFTIGPMRFTRELLCMKGHKRPRPTPGDCGGGVNFDIYDIHPYTTGSPAHEGGPNDVQLGDLHKLTTLLRAADRAGRINSQFEHTPLWITEISWDSKPPDPGGLPFRVLKRWTAEALFRAWRAGISDVFWFSLRDFRPDPDLANFESLESGLFFRGETLEQDLPKPNMYAFRFPFVAYSHEKGLRFWGRTPNSGPGKVRIQVRREKRWQTVLATRADSVGIFRGSAPTHYGRNLSGAVRAHFRKGSSVPFSMKPIADFPQGPFGNQEY